VSDYGWTCTVGKILLFCYRPTALQQGQSPHRAAYCFLIMVLVKKTTRKRKQHDVRKGLLWQRAIVKVSGEPAAASATSANVTSLWKTGTF
jgi:hypothetical protein